MLTLESGHVIFFWSSFCLLIFLETIYLDCTLHSCRRFPNFLGFHFGCYSKLETVLVQPIFFCIFQLCLYFPICATFVPQQVLQIAVQWGMCLPCRSCILYDSTPCRTSHTFQSPLGSLLHHYPPTEKLCHCCPQYQWSRCIHDH